MTSDGGSQWRSAPTIVKLSIAYAADKVPATKDDADRTKAVVLNKKPKILVVDDVADNSMVISLMLSQDGYVVETAASAEAALELLQSKTFDLVLMDVMMPNCDGVAATRLIRALKGPIRDVPIVAITASSDPVIKADCLAAGMQDYMPKPFTLGQLRTIISRWLVQA